MNPSRKIALAIVALTLLSWSPIHAAGEVIKTEFLTLAFNGSPPGYYYRNGKDVLKLQASRQGITAPIFYTGSRVLFLYEKESDLNPPKEGVAPPKPLLKVTLPAKSDRVLLIFAFQGKDKPVPILKAYGISNSSLHEGDYRVLNFSKQDIFVILNDKKSAVARGKQTNISGASWRKKVQDMDVSFGMKVDGKIRSVYSSVWGHRPERRNFIFVFDRGDRFRPLDIRMFFDVPAVSAARKGGKSGGDGDGGNSPG